MRKNIKLLLLLSIMISFVSTAKAEEQEFDKNASESSQTIVTGWECADSKCYYYIEGEMQKGIIEIDGEKYYFDDNGVQQTGLITVDGKIYLFENTMQYGFRSVYNKETDSYTNYYFGKEGYAVTGIIEENGEKYFINDDGNRYYGWKTIDGNTYFFDPEMLYGFQNLRSSSSYERYDYYFNEEGIMQIGLIMIDDKYYYFNELGERTYGTVTIDGVTYDVGKDPKYINGIAYKNDGYYYYNEEGEIGYGAGIVEVNNNEWNGKFYVDENGKVLRGFQTVNGKTYYFDYGMFYGLQAITENNETNYYYFDDEGVMQTGLITINGENYYFDETGKRVFGEVEIDGTTYDFGANPYYINHIISRNNGKKYFYNEQGKLAYGAGLVDLSTLQSEYHSYGKIYVNEDGSLHKGFKDIDGKTYYFDEYEYMITGLKTINFGQSEYQFYFNDEGVMQTGFITINGEEYYFDETGKRVFGEVEKDGEPYDIGPNPKYTNTVITYKEGQMYYFNESGNIGYGAGFVEVETEYFGTKKYYINEEGIAVRGFTTIDNNTYYFAPEMVTGFYEIYDNNDDYYYHAPKSEYYFNKDGIMQTGLQVINGITCYFDESGKRQYGTIMVDGKTYDLGKDPYYINNIITNIQTGKTYYYNENGEIGYNAGFVKISSNTYYVLEDGSIYDSGFIEIDKNIYNFNFSMSTGRTIDFTSNERYELYFNKDGILQTGLQLINNKYYFFDDLGIRQYGTITIDGKIYDIGQREEQNIDTIVYDDKTGKSYYYNEDGELELNKEGILVTNNYTIYIYKDGSIHKGFKTIDGKTYYFDSVMITDTIYQMHKPGNDYGEEYYFDEYGVMQTGLIKSSKNNQYYYFDESGKRQYGTITIDGKTYTLTHEDDANVIMKYDNNKGKYYILDTNTGRKLNYKGIAEIEMYRHTDKYYFDEEGYIFNGMKTIDGKTYYFYPRLIRKTFVHDEDLTKEKDSEKEINYRYGMSYIEKNNVMYTTDEEINYATDNFYYFNEDGIMLTGLQQIEGDYYYFNESGKIQYGTITIDGTEYELSAPTGKGLVFYNNKLYLYINYKLVKEEGLYNLFSQLVYVSSDGTVYQGFKTIDGKTYYFNPYASIGLTTIEDADYFFNRVGVMQLGNHYIGKNLYHFGQDGKKIEGNAEEYQNLIYEGGKVYYSVNGKLQKSKFITIDNKLYFFGYADGSLQKIGFFTKAGKTYYADTTTGEIYRGLYKIGNATYYFNNSGVMQKGLITIEGKQYYFDANGKLQKSKFINIDNKLYFFSYADGSMQKNGFFTKGGKTYYADKSTGEIYKGLHTINNATYYFNNSGVMQKGLITIEGKQYYFDNNGKMAKSKFVTIDNKLYFFSYADGSMQQNGFFTKGGKTYYADKSTGEIYKGLHTINNATYYFNNSGVMQKGLITIEGKQYYFDNNGKMAKSKFVTIDNKLYFFSYADGSMQKNGFFTKAGKTYYADTTTGEIYKGLHTINNATYYFNNSGVMQKGLITIEGKQYYFDNNGKMAKSKFVTIDNKLYFFSYADGSMQKNGFFTKAGKTYYADTSTGEIYTGTKIIDGKEYTFDKNGVLQN